jgi:hypothetical protein
MLRSKQKCEEIHMADRNFLADREVEYKYSQKQLLFECVRLLREILHRMGPPVSPPITGFVITHEGDPMQPIAPGFSPVFTASPLPVGAVLAPGQPVPTWESSDPVNAPVTADSTGLIATVAIPSTAVVGTAFNLSISYTNADGTVAIQTDTFTIVAAVTDITGFTIEQTA